MKVCSNFIRQFERQQLLCTLIIADISQTSYFSGVSQEVIWYIHTHKIHAHQDVVGSEHSNEEMQEEI